MLKVYYSDIYALDAQTSFDEFCEERKEYVNSISNVNRKKQSIYVWKLLLIALKKLNINHQGFCVKNSKWELKESNFKFSLSHSNNVVAVAISNANVGVDVEMFSPRLIKVCKRIFPAQRIPKNKTEESFYGELWTKRECEIKSNQSNHHFSTFTVSDCLNNKYLLGVTSSEKASLKKVDLV